VSPAVLERYLQRLFEIGDTNNDGCLDPQELAVLLVKSGLDFSWKVIRKIVKAADINHDGLIEYTEFVPMMLKIIWAEEEMHHHPPSRIPPPPETSQQTLLAMWDATTPGFAQDALHDIISAKEKDIIQCFLRDDIWLDNALPRGVHFFNHVPDDDHMDAPPHCRPGRDLTMAHNDLPDLEAELKSLQLRRATHDRVRELFDILDTTCSLHLSEAVCAQALGPELASRFIMKMDNDKDGQVSLSEWMRFFEEMASKAAMQGLRGDVFYKSVCSFVEVVLSYMSRKTSKSHH
jgi:Ca2+-binding EF-hand superfamily protein